MEAQLEWCLGGLHAANFTLSAELPNPLRLHMLVLYSFDANSTEPEHVQIIVFSRKRMNEEKRSAGVRGCMQTQPA